MDSLQGFLKLVKIQMIIIKLIKLRGMMNMNLKKNARMRVLGNVLNILFTKNLIL